MAIDAVKVPTDIQVEEKILGPITLRQIFLLVGCGTVSFLLWELSGYRDSGNIMATLFCWSPLGIGAAFAFIKINDVSLTRLLLLQLERIYKPSIRTFGPRQGITINIRTNTQEEKKTQTKQEAPQKKIRELSSALDTSIASGKKVTEGTPPAVDRSRVQASPTAQQTENIDAIQASATTNQTESAQQQSKILQDIVPPPRTDT